MQLGGRLYGIVIFLHCPKRYSLSTFRQADTLLLGDPVVAAKGNDVLVQLKQAYLAMANDRLWLEGRPTY